MLPVEGPRSLAAGCAVTVVPVARLHRARGSSERGSVDAHGRRALRCRTTAIRGRREIAAVGSSSTGIAADRPPPRRRRGHGHARQESAAPPGSRRASPSRLVRASAHRRIMKPKLGAPSPARACALPRLRRCTAASVVHHTDVLPAARLGRSVGHSRYGGSDILGDAIERRAAIRQRRCYLPPPAQRSASAASSCLRLRPGGGMEGGGRVGVVCDGGPSTSRILARPSLSWPRLGPAYLVLQASAHAPARSRAEREPAIALRPLSSRAASRWLCGVPLATDRRPGVTSDNPLRSGLFGRPHVELIPLSFSLLPSRLSLTLGPRARDATRRRRRRGEVVGEVSRPCGARLSPGQQRLARQRVAGPRADPPEREAVAGPRPSPGPALYPPRLAEPGRPFDPSTSGSRPIETSIARPRYRRRA